jgi:hypothetical protein
MVETCAHRLMFRQPVANHSDKDRSSHVLLYNTVVLSHTSIGTTRGWCQRFFAVNTTIFFKQNQSNITVLTLVLF